MNYNQTLEYLYDRLPMFQRIGSPAFHPGLETVTMLSKAFGNPHKKFKTIHVGGTNGKGSVSHLLAAILQLNGYKVGLYTSPHLVDFRERMRINGEKIPREKVVDFVALYDGMTLERNPSFFELTMVLAFDWFAKANADVVVVEVGLGGRLDGTNIIIPDLSIITNISFDHVNILGDTLEKIASEKAGIIKPKIPVVIGEAEGGVRRVFSKRAEEQQSTIVYASEDDEVLTYEYEKDGLFMTTRNFGNLRGELCGDCQIHNARTVLAAVKELRKQGYKISDESVVEAFAHVCEINGLMGRWMILGDRPLRVCDTAHNSGGFAYISKRLKEYNPRKLHVVIGFVSDKDVDHILDLLPENARYYVTQANVPRAMSVEELKVKFDARGFKSEAYTTVAEAYDVAMRNASKDDFIYVGGSTFVVADVLTSLGYDK